MLSPEGNPTFDTVAKVAKALGFELTKNSLGVDQGFRAAEADEADSRSHRLATVKFEVFENERVRANGATFIEFSSMLAIFWAISPRDS